MQGINRVYILGRLGHNPELRHTPSGKALTELRIATSYNVKTPDGWRENTDWHRVTCWEQKADVACRFLVKGSPVAIEGRMKTDTWDDAKTGNKRSRTYVVADRLHLVGSPGGGTHAADPSARGGYQQPDAKVSVAEEEIPF